MVRVLSSGVCPPIPGSLQRTNSDVGFLNPTGIMSNKELNFKLRVSKAIY